jgi:hypothetical protein
MSCVLVSATIVSMPAMENPVLAEVYLTLVSFVALADVCYTSFAEAVSASRV